MDFKTLLYFTTVAQELNFSRAAVKLNMSQPPLSNQIKELENDLGVQLFVRGKRHLTLTDAGRLFLRRALQIQELAEHTRGELIAMGNELSGTIRLGIVEGRAPFLASRWIAGFHKQFPRVTFSFRNGSSDDIIDLLSSGSIDLGVILAPYNSEQLHGLSVGITPWTAVIPAGHPLADYKGTNIPLRLLAGEPLIIPFRASRQQAIDRWFRGLQLEPNILCTLSNYTDMVALVEQNVGIGIFPQTTYTPNAHIVTKVIVEPARIAESVLVWNKNQTLFGPARPFVDYVKEFLAHDLIHSKEFRTAEYEFEIPENASIL